MKTKTKTKKPLVCPAPILVEIESECRTETLIVKNKQISKQNQVAIKHFPN